MTLERAREELEKLARTTPGIYGVGLTVRNGDIKLVAYGRPLALRKIPNRIGEYEVEKRVMLRPPEAFRIFKRFNLVKMPRLALDYAKGISRVTGLKLEEVLKSEPVKKYAKKLREEITFIE